jgi:hypothetical protein
VTRSAPPAIDPGLLGRFREAEARILWRPAPAARPIRGRNGAGSGPRTNARIARLDDEEARVEERRGRAGASILVESGPVGALVLLVRIDRQGATPRLSALDGGVDPAFPNGAIVAQWSSKGPSTLGLKDLVEVARYALR